MNEVYINYYKIQFKPWYKLSYIYNKNTQLNYKKHIL